MSPRRRVAAPVRGAARSPLLWCALVGAVALAGCSDGAGEDATTTTAPEVGGAATATTVPAGAPPGAEVVGLRELETGQCFEEIDDPTVGDKAAYLVDCADPHTFEVYDIVDYEGEGAGRGTSYPGTATVQNWSEQACFDRFEAFVGVRWTLSDLDIEVWWPSEESWGRGDRSVICSVVSSTGDKITGSQRGAAR